MSPPGRCGGHTAVSAIDWLRPGFLSLPAGEDISVQASKPLRIPWEHSRSFTKYSFTIWVQTYLFPRQIRSCRWLGLGLRSFVPHATGPRITAWLARRDPARARGPARQGRGALVGRPPAPCAFPFTPSGPPLRAKFTAFIIMHFMYNSETLLRHMPFYTFLHKAHFKSLVRGS